MKVAWSAKTRLKQGQLVHSQYQEKQLQADRSFQKEVSIRHVVIIRGWELVIRGRIDGLRLEDDCFVLEEVKSSTQPAEKLSLLTLDAVPQWRKQVEIYLYFLYAQGKEARGRLVVISLADGSIHRLEVPFSSEIGEYIESQLSWVLYEYERRLAWLQERSDVLLQGVPFAHNEWRIGQQEMAADLLEGFTQQQNLLMSASTGYGKTAAALYAALIFAYKTGKKIFFASSRNTQQRMAEDTLEKMAQKGLPVRAISIRARDKICLNEQVVCHPDHCHYAVEYHDKVRTADLLHSGWERATEKGALWPDKVVEIAEENHICPFAYSIELAQFADVVIGDYNYLFDPYIRLAMISNNPADWLVIVDEAHNLPERAMGYASPEISLQWAWKALEKIDQQPKWVRFATPIVALVEMLLEGLHGLPKSGEKAVSLAEGVDRKRVSQIANEIESLALDYALEQLNEPLFPDEEDAWLRTARGVLRFQAYVERAKEESVVLWRRGFADRWRRFPRQFGVGDLQLKSEDTGVKILCRDPSELLKQVFSKVSTSLCMSATLHPFSFYRDMLGIELDRCRTREFSSTFPPENRAAFVLPQVSTAYRDRQRDRELTAQLISKAVQSTPGNCAVFFPSFAFRDDILPLLKLGQRHVLLQQPRMNPFARRRMLAQLKKAEGDVLLGVMGGIFSEGIDLPAEALICAIMVGPSLPQANMSRRLIADWYEKKYGQGFRYGWLIPGMSRVAQAAGRVIRGPTEKGTVVLIGKRFLRSEYLHFLQAAWDPQKTADISQSLQSFWLRSL